MRSLAWLRIATGEFGPTCLWDYLMFRLTTSNNPKMRLGKRSLRSRPTAWVPSGYQFLTPQCQYASFWDVPWGYIRVWNLFPECGVRRFELEALRPNRVRCLGFAWQRFGRALFWWSPQRSCIHVSCAYDILWEQWCRRSCLFKSFMIWTNLPVQAAFCSALIPQRKWSYTIFCVTRRSFLHRFPCEHHSRAAMLANLPNITSHVRVLTWQKLLVSLMQWPRPLRNTLDWILPRAWFTSRIECFFNEASFLLRLTHCGVDETTKSDARSLDAWPQNFSLSLRSRPCWRITTRSMTFQ